MRLALVLLALAAAPAAAPAPAASPAPIDPPPAQEANLAAHGAYLARLKAHAEKVFASGDLEGACTLTERIAELSPEDPTAQLNLGFCRYKQGRKEENREATFKAIAQGGDKTRRDAYFNLGSFDEAPEVTDVMGGPTASSSCGQYVPSGHCKVPLRWCTVTWNNGGKALEENAEEILISSSRSEVIECAEQVDRASVLAMAGRGTQRPDVSCAEVQESLSLTRHSANGTAEERPTETCKVVYADACGGRIGLYCRRWDPARLRFAYVGEERSVTPARE